MQLLVSKRELSVVELRFVVAALSIYISIPLDLDHRPYNALNPQRLSFD